MIVTEHWHRFPRRVLESLLLEILKILLDTLMDNLFYTVLLEQRFGPDDLQMSLPTLIML